MLTELKKYAQGQEPKAYAWIDEDGKHAAIEFPKEGMNDGDPSSRMHFDVEAVDYLKQWLQGIDACLSASFVVEQSYSFYFKETDTGTPEDVTDDGGSSFVKVLISCDESVLPQLIIKGLVLSGTIRY